MTRDEAYEVRRQECIALQRENRKLKADLEKLAAGTYVSSEKSGNLKTINRLTQENQKLRNQSERYKANWQPWNTPAPP